MRAVKILLSSALAFSVAACSSGTFAVVTLDQIGTPSTPVHTVDLQLTLGTMNAQTTIREKSGGDLTFPTDAALQIRNGSGSLGLVAIARDAGGAELGRGGASVDVASNKTSRVSIAIDFTGGTVVGDMGGAGDMPGSSGPSLAMDHQPSYDFGTVVVGSSSSTTTFTVTNNGGSASGALGAATLGGANADQFVIGTDGCSGQILSAGATCTVTVTLHPTAAGTPAASISVGATPGGNASTALSGVAVTPGALSVAPSPVQFNAVVINGGTDDQPVTVTNTGGAASGPVSLAVGGSDAAMFTITAGTCTSNPTLAPGGSCSATVHFAPTAAGARAATLTANATPGGPGVTNLQGTGLTGSMLAFTPPTAFSTLAAGSSATQLITLKNNGTQDSGPLGSPSLSGDASFSVVSGGTCATGTALPGGMSCTYKIQFAPTTFGTKNAMISVTGSPGGTATASLSGTASQVFTLTVNVAGNGTGTVSIDGTGCASYPCTKMYTVTGSTSASLSESPATSSNFTMWSGDCTGTGACTPAMNQNRSVTATFTLKKIVVTVDLTLVHGAAGSVSASAVPAGPALSCNATQCTGQYDYGSTVTLTAAPTGSNVFQSWAASPCASRYSTTCGTGSLTADFSTSVTFRAPVNYVFVTSQAFMPNTFGSNFAGADLDCDAAAKAAGLFNTTGTTPTRFKAWLSTGGTGGVTAKSRLGTARGWMRVDGLEFADDLVNIPTKIFYPPSLDENGLNDVNTYAVTGTNGDGTADWTSATSDNTCNNWTYPIPGTGSHNGRLGDPAAGSGDWSAHQINLGACSSFASKLYCFETAFNTVVAPTPPPSKRFVFLSTNTWAPTGGRGPGAGSADDRCNLDKGALPGTYVALLSTSASPASDPARLNVGGPAWVRPDNVVIGSTNANFLAGTPQAPIDQQADGTYVPGFATAWTGANAPNQKSTSAASNSCGDWSVSTGTGDYGFASSLYEWFAFVNPQNCTISSRLYCVQQ